jgi:type IV pilus assembly protein PilE
MRFMRGFTLIEIMITVVIVAVIAAIAVPNYTDYVTRSKFAEATGHLSDLRVKLEQYYMDNRRYSSDTAGATCGLGNTIAVTNSKYFTYTCATGNANTVGAQSYTLTATGVAAEGLSGLAFTINQANARATTVASGSAIANKGYAANTGCWVKKKPSQC